MDLVEQVLVLHSAFVQARVPHAFGGALALAYWTEEPRGTRDIDCNIFVPADDSVGVLRALPAGVEVPADTAERVAAEGQIRLWWGGTPLDLFFDYAPVHRQAAAGARVVPLAGVDIRYSAPSSSSSSRRCSTAPRTGRTSKRCWQPVRRPRRT